MKCQHLDYMIDADDENVWDAVRMRLLPPSFGFDHVIMPNKEDPTVAMYERNEMLTGKFCRHITQGPDALSRLFKIVAEHYA